MDVFQRLLHVLLDAVALLVNQREVVQGVAAALFGGALQPFDGSAALARRGYVGREEVEVKVIGKVAQFGHGGEVAAFDGLIEILPGKIEIAWRAFAPRVHAAEAEAGVGIATTGSGGEFF